jgi:hypothetical protein
VLDSTISHVWPPQIHWLSPEPCCDHKPHPFAPTCAALHRNLLKSHQTSRSTAARCVLVSRPNPLCSTPLERLSAHARHVHADCTHSPGRLRKTLRPSPRPPSPLDMYAPRVPAELC